MTVGEDIELWGRAAIILGSGGGALWLTVRLLWRLQALIETRFESLLDRARADVHRLELDLEAERVACRHQLADLAARITVLDARIRELLAGSP